MKHINLQKLHDPSENCSDGKKICAGLFETLLQVIYKIFPSSFWPIKKPHIGVLNRSATDIRAIVWYHQQLFRDVIKQSLKRQILN